MDSEQIQNLKTLFPEARRLYHSLGEGDIRDFMHTFLATCDEPIERKELTAFLPMLENLSLFATLSKEQLNRVIYRLTLENYDAGEQLIKKGEPGDDLFIILAGEVEVGIPDKDATGKGKPLMSQGEVFGEMSLLTGQPRTVDLFALSKCIVARLGKPAFDEMCHQSPEIATFITELLATRLGNSIHQMVDCHIGPYKLVKVIGEGGMGIVYKGQHQEINRIVALKMLPHKMAFDEIFVKQFLNEAELIGTLDHPNIVKLYGISKGYATYFMILEFIEGQPLTELIKKDGFLSPLQALEVIEKISSALQFAHDNGITHQDIKPENIMITKKGDVKLLDFGIAAMESTISSEQEREKKVAGTLGYMSPEQAQGETIDHRSDIYSFGIVCYYMLTGKMPYEGRSLLSIVMKQVAHGGIRVSGIRKDIPPWMDDFIFHSLNPDRNSRIQNYHSIIKVIDRIKHGSLTMDCSIPFKNGNFLFSGTVVLKGNPWEKQGFRDILRNQKALKTNHILTTVCLMILTAVATFLCCTFLFP